MKITLNELRNLVRQTLKEEAYPEKSEVEFMDLREAQQDLAVIIKDLEQAGVSDRLLGGVRNVNSRLKRILNGMMGL
jgi:hypothetical protein